MEVEATPNGGETSHDNSRIPVHIEAALRPLSTVPSETIRARVLSLLEAQGMMTFQDGPIDFHDDAVLKQEVQSLRICDTRDGVSFWQGDVRVHVFQLSDEGVCEETLEGADPGSSVNACYQWVLPAREFDGLWDSLVFGNGNIKDGLLAYVSTALLFSARRDSAAHFF